MMKLDNVSKFVFDLYMAVGMVGSEIKLNISIPDFSLEGLNETSDVVALTVWTHEFIRQYLLKDLLCDENHIVREGQEHGSSFSWIGDMKRGHKR
jgi:hypothetical protein